MEIKNKRIDLIKNIDKKNNIIAKNTKLIDNLFLNKLYRNYLIAHKKKKHYTNFELIFQKPEKKKLAEKIIISRVIKNIPPNLLQYFNEFEFKKYANQLIISVINKRKKNKSFTSQKNKGKIHSRNQSCSYRLNINNFNYTNNTYNDGNKIKIFDSEEDKKNNNINNKINQKKYYLSSSRKNSVNIYRNKYITICDNTTKETQENNKMNNNYSYYYDKLYSTMSSKNNKYKSSIFNTNNSVNNLIDDDTRVKPKSSRNLNHTNYNIDTKINYITDYKNLKVNKSILNISNNNDKKEKKNDSKILLSNDRRNLFNLPKKKIKTELLINSLAPEEINIADKASNILNNLKEIKMEIKTEKNDTPKNIKHMIYTIKKERNKDVQYLKNEVKKNKFYEYYIENKKYMENKKDVFKVLRNSFNTERTKRNSNEISFIKTLNNICQQEKYFDSVVKHVYRHNYWLRLNKNKKNAENIKYRINKINEKRLELNILLSKINKLNKKNNTECNDN